MSPAYTAKTQGQSPRFDKISFIKYMKNIGRAYRKQATELVSISRTFVQVQNQAFDPDADQSLRRALQAVDEALKFASEAGTKTSEEANEKFAWATETLHSYGTDWHPRDSSCDESKFRTVKERMAEAKAKDGSTSSILDTLKEKLLNKPTPSGWSKPTTIVEFLVFKSLPDDKPTVVKQMLGEGSKLPEVLWNFSRYKDPEKHLTLKQNPHFYKDLPCHSREYGDDFRRDPVDGFLDTPGHKIFVLTDRQGRIYLETGQTPRAFGNVWCPQKSIIFKDVCGKLEGEGIVGSSIKDKLDLRCCVERLSAPAEANPMDWEPLQDWEEPIRRLLKSPDPSVGNIRIGTEQSGPPKRRQVRPFVNSPSGTKRAPSSTSQPLPAVAARIPSNHETAKSPLPSSIPTQPRPTTTMGILSNQGTAPQFSPPSTPTQHRPAVVIAEIPPSHGTAESTPTQPRPDVTKGILLSNHGTAQSPPHSLKPRPTGMLGIPSNHGTAPQFPPPSPTPTQPRPAVIAGISSSHKTAPSPRPSTPTRPRPEVTKGIPLNHGTAQFPQHSQQSVLTSSLPDRATSALAAPGSLMNLTPVTPTNVAPERQSQMFNISLSVAVTPRGVTGSPKPQTGSTRNVASYADPPVSEPQGPASKVPRSDATLPPPATQQKPVQRPVWHAWVQKVWKSGR